MGPFFERHCGERFGAIITNLYVVGQFLPDTAKFRQLPSCGACCFAAEGPNGIDEEVACGKAEDHVDGGRFDSSAQDCGDSRYHGDAPAEWSDAPCESRTPAPSTTVGFV